MKRIGLWICALLFATSAGAETLDRIACVVDDQVVSLSEVQERVRVLQTRSPQASTKTLMREATDALIAERLLEKQLEALGIDIRPSELQMAIEDVVRQNRLPSEEALREALERQGMEWEEYRESLRKQLAQMKLINLRVRSQVQIGEDEIKRRYAEVLAAERGEEEVRASHVLVHVTADAPPREVEAAHAAAAEITRRARGGEDLSSLEKAFASDAQKTSGGDLGWFRRGEMVRELEEVAFSLERGGISEPLRSRFGWHVLRLEDRREIAPPSFEAMAPEIRQKLYDEELERHTQRFVEGLKKDAVIEYPMEELAPPSVRTQGR